MAWALVDANNKVQNIILYDGKALYTPAEGLTLKEVPDETQMGDTLTA